MTAELVITVATDAEIRLRGHGSEEGDEPLSGGVPHFRAVFPYECRPPRRREWLGEGPGDERRTGRELWQPHVEIVFAGVIRLCDAPRRPSDRAEPQSLIGVTRCSEAHDADCHEVKSTTTRREVQPTQ